MSLSENGIAASFAPRLWTIAMALIMIPWTDPFPFLPVVSFQPFKTTEILPRLAALPRSAGLTPNSIVPHPDIILPGKLPYQSGHLQFKQSSQNFRGRYPLERLQQGIEIFGNVGPKGVG